ncbi:MAG: hypothetical protein TREMPRED_003709 [Tremellales sp. Tagirdzhanova-0007]|nr:MAG: hypothetical protein TREMPRED_003709 [Tremellales sp. Tagirdzhanova-0007]
MFVTELILLFSSILLCTTARPTSPSPRASTVASNSTLLRNPRDATCYDVILPISFEVNGYEWIRPRWTNDYEMIDYIGVEASRRPYNKSQIVQSSTIGGNYSISGTFCIPNKVGSKASTVILATHGLWYDRNYWSLPFETETYNFADRAIAQGYSLFLYDRLGVGGSSKLSGFEAQALHHVQVLRQLIGIVQSNTHTSAYLPSVNKTVLIGHAYGSIIMAQLLQFYPNIADVAILETLAEAFNGAVSLETFAPRIAAVLNSTRFGYADPGYLTWPDKVAAVNNNFKLGYYTDQAVDYLESHRTAYSVMEPLTQGFLNLNATQFPGPTLVLNGEFTSTVCQGYCPGVTQADFIGVWRAATPLDISIVPGCAHSLHLCSKVSSIYDQIFAFLQKVGY